MFFKIGFNPLSPTRLFLNECILKHIVNEYNVN